MLIALSGTGIYAQTWKSDKMHSHITFTITHLAVSDVDGKFTDFNATITASKPNFSDAKVSFTANTASVNTDNADRDGDLKSVNFFEVSKYPTLTYVSSAIKPAASKNHYTVTGNMTLHGVTKVVQFELFYRGTVVNPMSKAPTAGFTATGKIKRSAFGFGSKYTSPVLSDEITFKASGEFSKTN